MRAHVLLNLVNELSKRDVRLTYNSISFSHEFDKFNNTRA